jgi:hypothetical protein
MMQPRTLRLKLENAVMFHRGVHWDDEIIIPHLTIGAFRPET